MYKSITKKIQLAASIAIAIAVSIMAIANLEEQIKESDALYQSALYQQQQNQNICDDLNGQVNRLDASIENLETQRRDFYNDVHKRIESVFSLSDMKRIKYTWNNYTEQLVPLYDKRYMVLDQYESCLKTLYSYENDTYQKNLTALSLRKQDYIEQFRMTDSGYGKGACYIQSEGEKEQCSATARTKAENNAVFIKKGGDINVGVRKLGRRVNENNIRDFVNISVSSFQGEDNKFVPDSHGSRAGNVVAEGMFYFSITPSDLVNPYSYAILELNDQHSRMMTRAQLEQDHINTARKKRFIKQDLFAGPYIDGQTSLLPLEDNGNNYWRKTIGFDGDDVAFSAVYRGSNVILAGLTAGFEDDNRGQVSKGWVVALDIYGNYLWDKAYNYRGSDKFNKIYSTRDNGYVLAGATGYGYFTATTTDGWIVKLDSKGKVKWQTSYGKDGQDELTDIIETSNGDYIAVGYTATKKDEPTYGWIIKLDKNGKKVWERFAGGDYNDGLSSVVEVSKGHYIASGYTGSFNEKHDLDGWVISFDEQGKKAWEKHYGNEFDNGFRKVVAANGWSILVGDSATADGRRQAWAIKVYNSNGSIYVDPNDNSPQDLLFNQDEWSELYDANLQKDGIVLAGLRRSIKNDTSYGFLAKIDQDGNLLWQRELQNNHWNALNGVYSYRDDLIVYGITLDLTSSYDAFISKLNHNGELVKQ